MTLQEFLDSDNSFYHVTQTSNIQSILEQGLRNGNPLGICVIRSRHPLVIRFLVEMMLYNSDESSFSIIEIKPSQHNLKSGDIRDDQVVEETNPLHNYIRRRILTIKPEHIVDTYEAHTQGIADKETLVRQMNQESLIWSFDK